MEWNTRMPFGILVASLLLSNSIACSRAEEPLKKIAEVPLPDAANRFDYQSIDPRTGLLYLSHMGVGKLVVFDAASNRVVANLPGYKTDTGTLAVPQEGKVYTSAAGDHEVVVTDLKTLKIVARIPGARFPDGIAYAPKDRKIFVSDESGGIDLVIDARTNKRLGKIDLGGEAGNTHYDPVTDRIWVAVQTRNEMVEIDPKSQAIVKRYSLKESDHPHGFLLDSRNRLAYISCEGNNKLLVVDLKTMSVRQSFDVHDGPDVLAMDEGLGRLYVGCEGDSVDVFKIGASGLTAIESFAAPNPHTVAVDQKTHRVYVALQSVNGKPMMWVLAPTP